MTTNRARAYGRVIALIDQIGSTKLHDDEQRAIRDAADALLFTNDALTDPDARRAMARLHDVLDRLVATDRVLRETADRIVDAVEGCGPQTEPLQVPAAA